MISLRTSIPTIYEYDTTASSLRFLAEVSSLQKSVKIDKKCFNCHATTASKWYKNLSDKSQDQCEKCYGAAKTALALSGNSGKTCFMCNTVTSSQWYKNPLDKNEDQCQKCYCTIKQNPKRKAEDLEDVDAKIPTLNLSFFG